MESSEPAVQPAAKPKRGFSLRKLIRDAVLVYLAAIAILFSIQRYILFPTSHAITRLPCDKPYALKYDDLYLDVGTEKTNAWYVYADRPRGTILFSRGNGGTLSMWLDFAFMLRQRGFDVLVYDYGGYGRSTGKPSETRCYADARAMWEYLVKTRGIAPNRIALLGHSLGGGVTAQLASEVTPGAVILESTFFSLPQVCQEKIWWMPVKPLVWYRFNSGAKLKSIHAPILIVHSPDDTLIPFHHGKDLFAAANGPKQFLQIRGDHNEGPFVSGALYTDGIATFLYPLFPEEAKP